MKAGVKADSCVFLALHFNVFPDHGFVDSNRRDEKSFRPYSLLIPIYVLQETKLLRQFSACILFQRFHHGAYRVSRGNYHVQMHMIFFHPYRLIFPVRIILPYLLKFRFQILLNPFVQDFSSVPRDPHDVILRSIYRIR